MKIPRELRNFAVPALVVVTAKRQAQVYFAHDDSLDLIDTIKVEAPRYTDREGFFGKRMGGRLQGSGAVYEHRKEKLEHEFVPEFTKHIKAAIEKTKAKDIFLFLPAYQSQFILPALSKIVMSKLRMVIKRNYYGRRPLEIIKKLQASLSKPMPKPEKPEVAKLLGRPSFKPSFSA